jgi:membrane-associated phospholipid phosphatase
MSTRPIAGTGNDIDPIAALKAGWHLSSRGLLLNPASIVLAASMLGLAAGLALTGIRIGIWAKYGPFVLALLCLYPVSVFLAGLHMRRLSALVETFAVLSLIALTVPLLTCLMATSALPWTDALCVWMDAQLGISWPHVAFWFRDRPLVSHVMSYAYASLAWQTPLVILALGVARPDLLRVLTSAWAVTLAVTVIIFPFMPSLGGYLYYDMPHAMFPDILQAPAWRFMEAMGPARDGSLRILEESSLEGLINFPSFHAAAAVIYAWALWQVPYVRYPALVLNVLMFISSVPCGGHYIVDVIAGAAIAVSAIWFANRYPGPALASHTIPDPLDEALAQTAERLRLTYERFNVQVE